MDRKEQTKLIKERSGTDTKKCMKCGKCSGRCPVYEQMDIKPHQFVSMIEKGQIEELLNCKSLNVCLSCFACLERCPRGVAPVQVIEAVRQEAIRVAGGNRLNSEDIPAMVDDKIPQQLLVSMFRKLNK